MLHVVTGEIIRQRFPGRVVLTPEDVAEVWRGSRSRDAVGAIRKRLTRGTLIPGLRKSGGRWEIPVEALVQTIERMTTGGAERDEDAAPVHPQAAPHGSTRRRPIGPRMSDVVGFWESVFEALDLNAAEEEHSRVSAGVIWEWKQVSAAERKEMADRVIHDRPRTTYTDDEAAILCGRHIRTMRRWRDGKKAKEKAKNNEPPPEHRTRKVGNHTEIVYTRSALLKWLRLNPDEQATLGVMLWKVDKADRVALEGERVAGSLLDLLLAEHASRESLALAMGLYRQQAAGDLDAAVWRLVALPEDRQRKPGRVF